MCRIAVLHAVAAACLVSMPAAVRAQAFTQPQADAAVERALPLLQSSAKTWHEKRACFSCHHQGLGILAVAVARERGFNIDAEMLADEVRKSARPPGTRDRLLLREISFNELERELQSANVNASTHSGLTALMWAAHDPDKVGRLLAAGANPKLTARSGHSLLIAAGYDGASRSVQALLDAGADVEAVTTQGQITPFTALVRAAMRGDTAMVRSLHARGARTVAGESSLRMPVLMAAVQGDTAMVALLLELGAPIDARYPKEYEEAEPTLLMQAIAEGHPDVVKLLLSRGASVHLGDSRGWTPLMYAAAGIDRGDTRSLEAVLQARPDLSAITPQGETAHALAVRYGNYTAAALLRRASDQGRARDADVGAENRSAAPL